MSKIVEGLLYSREHEWVRIEGGRVRVGITDYAQDQLGDVVFVGLPEPGTEVNKGQPLGEVESTKSVSDIYSPVNGAIAEVNSVLEEHPELINEDPYGEGWLVVIEGTEGTEELLDGGAYRALITDEG